MNSILETLNLSELISAKCDRRCRAFVMSFGIILAIAGLAKLYSAFGHARILERNDPIFAVTFRQLMTWVGAVELLSSFVCLLTKRMLLSAALVAWLSTSFVVYRIGLIAIGWQPPCSCLGTLNDSLPLPPQMVDGIMKMLAAYMLIASYYCLIRITRKNPVI